MKEKWKKFRLWAILFSVAMILLGVLTLIWPGISATAVCILLGVICIGTGICEMIRYFKMGLAGLFFQHDLLLGIFSILAGILLLIHPLGAATFLPVIAGLYLVMGSIFEIQIAAEMHRLGIGGWVGSLVFGIIGTVFAFFLILDPFDGVTALMIYLGALMVIGGIQGLYAIHCISKVIKQSRNNNVIDVAWRPVD